MLDGGLAFFGFVAVGLVHLVLEVGEVVGADYADVVAAGFAQDGYPLDAVLHVLDLPALAVLVEGLGQAGEAVRG